MPKDIKYIEAGFVAMNVADAAMTIYCVEKGTCIEKIRCTDRDQAHFA